MWCKSAVQILYEHWGVYSLFRGGKILFPSLSKGCASVQNKIYKDDSVTKGCNQNSERFTENTFCYFEIISQFQTTS